MKITSQEEYGLRCLLQLARVEPGHSLTIAKIADQEGLSHPYVAKLLAVLRQAGLIESVRGSAGGYRLAGTPAEVTLGTILKVLGEPLFDALAFCDRHRGTEGDGPCVHQSSCTLRALWQTLESWMRQALDQISLADLLQNEGRITELLRARLAQAVLEDVVPASFIPLTAVSGQ